MFFIEENESNFGNTLISNVFIDIFMPMADGLAVKVYLLGYRMATDRHYNPKFDNLSIAQNLDVPLSDVINAWKFWQSSGIIKIHQEDLDNEFNFSVEFLDLDAFYQRNIVNNAQKLSSNADNIVERNSNPKIRKMFNEINKIIGRYLEPTEKISIMEMMDKYNMSEEMMVCAYEHSKDQTGAVKPLKYVEAIIRNWYDSNLYTVEEVESSFAKRSQRYTMYRHVFNELSFRREPTKAEKETMDIWFDVYKADIELVLEACSKSKNISNPNISYINGIIKNWADKEIHTISELRVVEELEKKEMEKSIQEKNMIKSNLNKGYQKNKKSNFNNNNKFKNFTETIDNYTPEELNASIKRSQEKKFK
ncbi:DnaD domain protein [Peptacetobacter sp.]|uniref:DnaD domain protein n=1 Tax=Peptacetobacter sp. TaxID=2991975 RepID=UPI00261368ED|nr:DnaD domain protein [Peptacetobacter sp.]